MRARLPLPGSAGPPLDQLGTAHNYSRSSGERVAEEMDACRISACLISVCMSVLLCVVRGRDGSKKRLEQGWLLKNSVFCTKMNRPEVSQDLDCWI